MFVFLHNIWDDIVVKYCKRGKSCNSDNGQIIPRRNAKSLARILMLKDGEYAEENDPKHEEIDECHHYDKQFAIIMINKQIQCLKHHMVDW